ncbi:hypothetical protein YSKK_20460 [Halopseudomonas aestusnigri]|nr:hypothetical protein YSKK_20460 [Halopseudomonas aestusnigri]
MLAPVMVVGRRADARHLSASVDVNDAMTAPSAARRYPIVERLAPLIRGTRRTILPITGLVSLLLRGYSENK